MSEYKDELDDDVKVIDFHTNFKLPQCCEELWDNCPHIARREKPKKGNIGL